MILHKFRSKYLFAGLLTAIFFTQTWKSSANYSYHQNFYTPLTAQQDTVPQKTKDSLVKKPSISTNDTLKNDSLSKDALIDTSINRVDTFDLKLSKDSLDDDPEVSSHVLPHCPVNFQVISHGLHQVLGDEL